jgi:hypothetical protein
MDGLVSEPHLAPEQGRSNPTGDRHFTGPFSRSEIRSRRRELALCCVLWSPDRFARAVFVPILRNLKGARKD